MGMINIGGEGGGGEGGGGVHVRARGESPTSLQWDGVLEAILST